MERLQYRRLLLNAVTLQGCPWSNQFSLGIFLLFFFNLIFPCFICLFFLIFHYSLLFQKYESLIRRREANYDLVINSLRFPMATVSFIVFSPHGGYGSRPVISPTCVRFTMASYENKKLTGTLGNAPQKMCLLTLTRKRLWPRL